MEGIISNINLDYKNDKYDLEKKLNERIVQLENELRDAKEYLQTAIEDGESSRDELKYANEELFVYNEELQSTNKKLQSVNAELLKINSKYKSKNQELIDLYNDMTNFLSSTGIGTIFLDENLCIRKFTLSITKEINLRAQDIGRPIYHLCHNIINDELNIAASEVIITNMSSEKEIQSKNGSWYLLKCAPYRISENLIKGVVLSLVDITRRKQAEIEMFKTKEENEKNKRLLDETILSENLKTEFFSNLSHELRTPLNVILCSLQFLEKFTSGNNIDDEEKKFKKYINIMKQNCYRQLRLVNNMIDITKLDLGFFELNLQNCNIVNIVESVTLSVAEYIENKSIKLIFDTDIEECIISCDAEKIERVILNLLSNSIKFTNQGGSMTVNMYDKGKDIIISIKDTGIGIPEDKLNIIFDRFRQVDRSLTRNQEGSGIGLSIVKSLIELHNGKISVLSEYGKGTEFIITLPVIEVSEEDSISEVPEIELKEKTDRIQIEFSDIYSLN